MTAIGRFLSIVGYAVWVLSGIVGLIITFSIVNQVLGLIFAIIGLFAFPFMLGLAPWYAGFALADWQPLLVIYGGGILGTTTFYLGAVITDRATR